jgi:asparagine synthase (glutamine-hydrolysing)
MCGIAGIVATSLGETGRPLASQLQPLLEAQAHRGPDAWGVWPVTPDQPSLCALGHRRLSIIDLSEAGRQPMSNADGSLQITFNGEIYNYQQLRIELESLGHHFRTRTDTETILYAYEQWGVECVKHLRGMFALGIWDERQRRLFLARDRVGKKPLVYTQVGNRFLFASELQGLLADREVPRQVNHAALDSYLSYGYIPAPHTAYQGVYKLPPAHWLTLDITPQGFQSRLERYWSLAYEPKVQLDAVEAGERLRATLTEAVRLRMISDVPLGAFLSGGIDSSIVVGLMAQLSGQPVKTFSIGFAEAAFDETEHARRIADKWQTEHHEFIVQPNALEILPKLVRHYGEPYADSSAVPTFYVSQLTRQHVTVALNGDGGDESFAGYERYLGNRVAERLHAVPGAAWTGKQLSRFIPDSIDPKNRLRTVRRFLKVAAQPMAERYTRWLSIFHHETKAPLYSRDFSHQLNGARDGYLAGLFANLQREFTHLDPVDAGMAVDVQSYLPFDLLVKVDITTMANSLEARSPFLDHEVMELAAQLPAQLKAPGRDLKALLKRTFADLLPPANVNRRKMGFGVPVGVWFRRELRDFVRDVLLSKQAAERGYFNRLEVERLVTEHQAGRADYAFQLWSLLMLELWQQEFTPR